MPLRHMQHAFEMSVKSIIKTIYLTVRGFALTTLSLVLSQKTSIPLLRNIESILFIRVDRLVGDAITVSRACGNAALIALNAGVESTISPNLSTRIKSILSIFRSKSMDVL